MGQTETKDCRSQVTGAYKWRLLKRLGKYDALIIDDIGYVQQSREEMEVLFTILADRYERGTVIDLRTRFKLPVRGEHDKRTRIIVAEVEDRTLGFVVDAVSEVIRIPLNTLEPPH